MKQSPGIKNSVQNDINWSFDEDFNVVAVELLSHNPVTDVLERVETIQGNPTFSYNLSGTTCVITQTLGTATYQKTIDWTTNPITESEWV